MVLLAAPHSRSHRSVVQSQMPKVLVVDDEAEIVDLISMVLDDPEIDLLTAYDGQEALEVIHQQRPDLVLTDIMMPRLDGKELCRLIKSDPATQNTAVILMSAGQGVDATECGADFFLHKPFNIAAVMENVTSFLEGAA